MSRSPRGGASPAGVDHLSATDGAPERAAVLLDADLAIDRGDFRLEAGLTAYRGVTALLGPNGSGKTTALMGLAGLQRLTGGRVRMGSTVWAGEGVDLAPERRSVGLVLAEPMLFPHLSLLDNVAFGPRSRGMPRRAARDRAQDELGRVGLAELAGRRPGEVSSGQAQRAALARALATDPALLLLDEPLSALDPQTRSRTRADLAARLRDYDGVTVLTTHDPLDALTLADRLVFLEEGRVTQEGTPAEVVARPRTAYVASVVGLNLLTGTLVRGACDTGVRGRTPVSQGDAQGGAASGEASAGPAGGAASGGASRGLAAGGAVGEGAAGGAESDAASSAWTVRLEAPGGGAPGALVLAEPPEGAGEGDRVWATVNPEAVALFTERPQTSARNLWEVSVDSVTVTGQRARVHLDGAVPLVADVTLGAVAALAIAEGRDLWAAVKATEITAYLA